MSPQSLNNASIETLAEKLVRSRKLYGNDSSYVIGVMAGVEMVLDNEGNLRDVQDRVVEIESGKAPSAKSAAEAPRGSRGDSALVEHSWTKGSVKWFNNDKGYGFISTGAETDVFVHWRDISSWDRSLSQGDEVEFMVTKTAKGFQAINVMKSGEGKEGKEGEGENDSPSATSGMAPESNDSGEPHPSPPNSEEDGFSEESGANSAPDKERRSQEKEGETHPEADEPQGSSSEEEDQESEVATTTDSSAGGSDSPPKEESP